MSTMRVQLQKEQDTVVMLRRESETNNKMMNEKNQNQKVDLDVCKSSVQTLERQLKESQNNTQNIGSLLA